MTLHTSLALPDLNQSRGLISQDKKHLCKSAGPLNGSHVVAQVGFVELIHTKSARLKGDRNNTSLKR